MASPPRDVWLRQALAGDALRRLVAALGAEHVLPVKGVLTSRTLYRDVSERPLADVDVRIARPTFARLPAAAAACGGSIWLVNRTYWTTVIDVGGIDLDVEGTIGPPGLCDLTVEAMLTRAREDTTVFGFPCLLPETHDHALLLLVNIFKDKLVLARPWSITDCELIAKTPGFEPSRLARLARDSGVGALAWTTSDWLAARGSAEWRAVRDALGPRSPRPVYTRLFRYLTDAAPASWPTRTLARVASDRTGMRAKALVCGLAYESDVELKKWRARRGGRPS